MIKESYRICSKCGRPINEGFYSDGNYYCDYVCLPYTHEEWDELYDDDEYSYYYTQWLEHSSDVELLFMFTDLSKLFYRRDPVGSYDFVGDMVSDDIGEIEMLDICQDTVDTWSKESCIDIQNYIDKIRQFIDNQR